MWQGRRGETARPERSMIRGERIMATKRKDVGRGMTIYDIAREAGVSGSTVSRVLAGVAGVSADKRARVMRIVEKYNFRPNALARGLANAKSHVIGIVTADICNPYYGELFICCEKAARAAGYTLLLFNSESRERDSFFLEKLQEQKVDGIIQIGGMVDDLITDMAYAEKVNQVMTTVPVIVAGKVEGTDCRMVRIDQAMTMELIMEYLLSLGHERIALVGGRMNVLSTYVKFMRYKQILRDNGIAFDPSLVAEDGGYRKESGYTLMNRMFDRGVVPTAVIAINEPAAAGVLQSIHEHDYKVPEDISLVSYDNTYIAELLTPHLTSIDYDYENFGKKLVDTAVIEGKKVEMLQTVTPRLVIRDSCCPCRKTLR